MTDCGRSTRGQWATDVKDAGSDVEDDGGDEGDADRGGDGGTDVAERARLADVASGEGY